MATCKECLYVEVCKAIVTIINEATELQIDDDIETTIDADLTCEYFADRSRFVELPDVGDYDTVTTIDEAIDHSYKIATSTDENVCAECKAEHMRLCGWLGDLKRRIIAEQALKGGSEKNGKC